VHDVEYMLYAASRQISANGVNVGQRASCIMGQKRGGAGPMYMSGGDAQKMDGSRSEKEGWKAKRQRW
jgi:hypothetical protein